MKKTTLFLTLLSLVIVSCGQIDPNKQIDEGKVTGEIYKSKEIGWSIEIPKGWSIISKDKVESNDQKGKDALEKASGLEIDTKEMKHLISFQKNQFNIFTSTSEPFKEEFTGEYLENNKALEELIFQTYVNEGIKADTVSGSELIQGLAFSTFYLTIYAPDGKVILNQIMYSRLINGYDFCVNINYNNEQDKKTMVDAWEKSHFN